MADNIAFDITLEGFHYALNRRLPELPNRTTA
jgi:hypothetical protein